ncbi:MAG: hypothetical protein DRI32_08990 [Chloroflexi bacterium]|nr:MAG: hypothetical protein DRI32_08990 [Chloroflexota bacterium]
MKPSKQSIIAVAVWTAIFIAGSFIDGHAASRRTVYNACVQATKIKTRVSYRIDHRAAERCTAQALQLVR